jgi:hypothetical protein
MQSKTEYQRFASDCLKWAARSTTDKERNTFLEMADAWTRIALVDANVVSQSAADEIATRPH